MVVVAYLVVCVAPVAAFAFLERVMHWFAQHPDRRPRRSVRASIPRPSIGRGERARLCRDLQRLGHEHDRLLYTDLPAKAARLRAIELAYDDTLRQACEALALDPLPRPLNGVERVQAEADLVVHGLTW